MDICPGCGTPMEEKTTFCAHCGYHISEAKSANERNGKKIKKKMVLFGSIAGVLVIAIAVAILYFSWHNSDEQRLKRALKKGDYAEALTLVQENSVLCTNDELAEGLKKQIAELKIKYINNEISYDSLCEQLDEIEGIKVTAISEDIELLRVFASDLKQSRYYFDTAEKFFADGDYLEAIGQYQLVITEDTNYDVAKSKIVEAQNEFRLEKLNEAAEYSDAENYSAAIVVLQDALKVLPEDSEITQKITLYEKNYADKQNRDVLNTAATYAEDEDYLSAMRILNEYLRNNGENADIRIAHNAYDEKYVDLIESEAENLAETGNCYGALEIVLNAQTNSSNTRLVDLQIDYEVKYANSVTVQADILINKKQFDDALSLIKDAMKIIPNSDVLRSKISEIDSIKPVSISEVKAVNAYRWNSDESRLEDTLGNTYYDAINAFVFPQYGYAEYYVNGMYDTITGMACSYHHMAVERACYLKIYADGKVIYSSEMMTRKTEPFQFEVKIPEGTKYIKIENVTDTYGCSDIMITDVLLWP